MSSMDYHYADCRLCGETVKMYQTEIERDVAYHLSTKHPVYWASFLALTFIVEEEVVMLAAQRRADGR